MKKQFFAWAVLLLISVVSFFTVQAYEDVLSTLPLQASGQTACLPRDAGDGAWHTSFRVPVESDYTLDNVQYLWRAPSGSVTVQANIHIVNADDSSSVVSDFNAVTVSGTSSSIYTLEPVIPTILLAGRDYVIRWTTNGTPGTCALAMDLSDPAPSGVFTYVDNIAPEMGRYVGFQINATGSGQSSAANLPPDSRFNWGYGDSHVAVLYPTESGVGVYDYASDTYVDLFFAEDIEQYLENPPAEAVLIAEYGSVRAYYLPTGEIQFNIGPDAEGKEYVYIISSLEEPSGYGYYFDPNE